MGAEQPPSRIPALMDKHPGQPVEIAPSSDKTSPRVSLEPSHRTRPETMSDQVTVSPTLFNYASLSSSAPILPLFNLKLMSAPRREG